MFQNYPKQRPPLSDEIKMFYVEHYKSNRDGDTAATGVAKKMERWMHKQVSADVPKIHSKTTLEIGAGTLNQLEYETPKVYDIVEPFKALYQNSKELIKVNKIYKDISDINISQKYDRIISTATFEHILDLPKVIATSCLLLNKDGVLRTSIPNEGTILWTLGWKLTTGVEFRLKHGLDYSNLMKHEHVNTAKEIESILNYFFNDNGSKAFGINKHLAFYRFFESKNPNIKRAEAYLKTYDAKS